MESTLKASRRPTPATRHPALFALVLALLAGSPLLAALQWYQHYERGIELAKEARWDLALEEFEAAAAQEPRPRERIRTYGREFVFAYDPAYQRARCLVELGRLGEAREQLAAAREAAVTQATALDALAERLRTVAAPEAPPPAPAAALGLLRVDSSPPGARVSLDGREAGTTPLAAREVEAVRHRLSVDLAGYEPWEEIVSPTPGEVIHLQVALRALPPAPLRPPAPAAEDPDPRTESASGAGRESAGLRFEPASSTDPQTEPSNRAEGTPLERTPEPSPSRTSEAVASVADGSGPPGGPGAAEYRAPLGAGRAAGWVLAALTAVGSGAVILGRRRRRRGKRRRRLAGYALEGELGRGGMATTYRALRLADRQPVALKVPHESGDPTFRSRFLREGKLGETLHHPRIVRIFEAGESEGRLFLAMELLEGRTLAEEIRRHPGGLPIRRTLELVHDICEALDYAHAKGVIHRDLKPENIMLLPDGLKVMDFGVARVAGEPGLTTSRFFFGSPLYAAPELVEPLAIDHRADLYSLGILLFEMLEGRPPFHHESVFRLLEMHQSTPLPPLHREIAPELSSILSRLCEKKPADRYASAQEILVEIKGLLFGAAAPRAGISA